MLLNTELEQFIYTIWDFNSESGEWPEYYKGVSEMMQIRDARIRAEARAEAMKEAADRAVTWYRQGQLIPAHKDSFAIKQLRAAILADEPKEDRQGCFRCRNRPKPGGDRQLCDSCRLIVGRNYDPAPLADEPKEEREGPSFVPKQETQNGESV